mgnify:CR=1 FL=1
MTYKHKTAAFIPTNPEIQRTALGTADKTTVREVTDKFNITRTVAFLPIPETVKIQINTKKELRLQSNMAITVKNAYRAGQKHS